MTNISKIINDTSSKNLKNYSYNQVKFLRQFCNTKGIIANETNEAAYKKLIFLEDSEIDINELKEYLQKYIMEHTPNCLKNNSELKRLIRIYDLVKYKQKYPNQISK